VEGVARDADMKPLRGSNTLWRLLLCGSFYKVKVRRKGGNHVYTEQLLPEQFGEKQ
jgi:hypothetical protein